MTKYIRQATPYRSGRLGSIERVSAVATPAGKLLFQLTGAFAEFERLMIRQRVRAGLNLIKEKLARDGKFISKAGRVRRKLGRPGAEPDKIERARHELAKGIGIGKVARKWRREKRLWSDR